MFTETIVGTEEFESLEAVIRHDSKTPVTFIVTFIDRDACDRHEECRIVTRGSYVTYDKALNAARQFVTAEA